MVDLLERIRVEPSDDIAEGVLTAEQTANARRNSKLIDFFLRAMRTYAPPKYNIHIPDDADPIVPVWILHPCRQATEQKAAEHGYGVRHNGEMYRLDKLATKYAGILAIDGLTSIGYVELGGWVSDAVRHTVASSTNYEEWAQGPSRPAARTAEEFALLGPLARITD